MQGVDGAFVRPMCCVCTPIVLYLAANAFCMCQAANARNLIKRKDVCRSLLKDSPLHCSHS